MYNFWTVALPRFVVLFFIVAVSVAIYFYPGGNIHNPTQLGYSITHNFLSDLGGYQSQSGAVNFLSAFFFNLSMFMFIGVGIAFIICTKIIQRRPSQLCARYHWIRLFLLGHCVFCRGGINPTRPLRKNACLARC